MGWSCFGTYSSAGSYLIGLETIIQNDEGEIEGAVVTLR